MLESMRTLLKITRLVSGKSYLVITGPNLHAQLSQILNYIKLESV